MHPSSTSGASVLPASLSSQHAMSSYNIPHQECWIATSVSTTTAAADCNTNSNNFQHHMQPTLQQEDVKEVEMKPLDLSLRTPRQQNDVSNNSNTNNNKNNNHHASSWPRLSSTSSSRSGSQRLSPYPFIAQSSGSLSSSPSHRHHGSPCLSQSRSPLTRSISPYYPYHRQTPSPYYLSGSCTPPDNCSSLHVLSSTNRLLNALSSVSTSQLRSYEDPSCSPAPPDLMGVCESRLMKDSETSNRRQHPQHQQNQQLQQQNNPNRDVDVEPEEPTYIDMDSSTTVVKSVLPSRQQVQHHHDSKNGMSSMYAGTTVMPSSSSNDLPMPHQTPLPTSQPHLHHPDRLSPSCSHPTRRSPPHELQSFYHLQHLQHPHSHPAAGSGEYPQNSITSRPTFISNDLHLTSSSLSLCSPSPLRSLPSSHTLHLCDSSNQGMTTSRDDSGRSNNNSSYPFYHGDNQGTVATRPMLASNSAADYVRDVRMDHQDNHHQQNEQPQTPTVVKEMLESQQHQNPDSSSSPSASSSSTSPYSSSTSSPPWMATSSNPELASPGNTSSSNNNNNNTIGDNSPISSHQRPPSPQMSPDSNISRSALSILQSPSSNKENIRFINGGSSAALSRSNTSSSTISRGSSGGGGGSGGSGSEPVSTGTTTARRSFFQIDKSRLEENSGSTLLTGDSLQNGDDSGRCSVLDFWISKILMEETPRRRCSADIRQTVDGNKRIRLRLVDLIELQVEQSLLKA